MNPNKSDSRVTFQRKLGYRNGVLVDDWFEERQRFTKGRYKHDSTYRHDYLPRDAKYDREKMWNNSIEGQGLDPRFLLEQDGAKYHDNFTSTTDLTINHLPKCKPNKDLRTFSTRRGLYLPEQDYTPNWGNLTQWGLKENKRALIRYASATDTSDWISETQEVFQPPPKEAYVSRRAISRHVSSFLNPVNLQNVDLPLRNEQINLVPEFPLKVQRRAYPHFYF